MAKEISDREAEAMGYALADQIETRAQHFIQQGVPRTAALLMIVDLMVTEAENRNRRE